MKYIDTDETIIQTAVLVCILFPLTGSVYGDIPEAVSCDQESDILRTDQDCDT